MNVFYFFYKQTNNLTRKQSWTSQIWEHYNNKNNCERSYAQQVVKIDGLQCKTNCVNDIFSVLYRVNFHILFRYALSYNVYTFANERQWLTKLINLTHIKFCCKKTILANSLYYKSVLIIRRSTTEVSVLCFLAVYFPTKCNKHIQHIHVCKLIYNYIKWFKKK